MDKKVCRMYICPLPIISVVKLTPRSLKELHVTSSYSIKTYLLFVFFLKKYQINLEYG